MARTSRKKAAVAKRARSSRKKATAAKRSPTKTAAPSAPSSPAPAAAGYRAKIRMYRQGLGDCFLISLPRPGNPRPYTIMIDCGVILGTQDPATKMTAVVDNIVSTTQGNIDLLLATHEHWDHLSGFSQAKASFDKLKVNDVWLGWTEDLKDPLTAKLKKQKDEALAALRLGLTRLQGLGAAGEDDAEELEGILGFFGAAKGATTGDALEIVRNAKNADGKQARLRYWKPGEDPVEAPGTGARLYVLGPPHDEAKLRRINPSARDKETYGLALDGMQLFMDGAGTALGEQDLGRPFDQQYEIPFAKAQSMGFFRSHYWQPKNAARAKWRRIDGDWLAGSPELALQLDSLTNNTSLVLAIELPATRAGADHDVLLFAADAQVGNWLSWQDLKWTVDGKTVTGPDLLARTILYKVGHHGSHNATLKEKGLEEMKRLRVALIPVDQKMAKKKNWNKMPLEDLLTALGKQAKGAILRVDKPMPATRENVVEDKLFFEVTF
jgi:hypothetical protein